MKITSRLLTVFAISFIAISSSLAKESVICGKVASVGVFKERRLQKVKCQIKTDESQKEFYSTYDAMSGFAAFSEAVLTTLLAAQASDQKVQITTDEDKSLIKSVVIISGEDDKNPPQNEHSEK